MGPGGFDALLTKAIAAATRRGRELTGRDCCLEPSPLPTYVGALCNRREATMARNMARKAKRDRKAPSAAPPRGTSDRDKAVDALMALLAEQQVRGYWAGRSRRPRGLETVAELRAEFGLNGASSPRI